MIRDRDGGSGPPGDGGPTGTADGTSVLQAAALALARLSADSGLVAVLAAPDPSGGILFRALDQDGRPRPDAPLSGTSLPDGAALAAGEVLAALPGAEARDGRAPSAARALVAARGYAIVDTATGRGAAAPVLDGQGRAVTALALGGPAEAMSRPRLHALGAALAEAARPASALAGGSQRPLSATPQPQEPPPASLRRISPANCIIGESPLHDPATGRLWWVDMYDPSIWRLDPGATAPQRFPQESLPAALAVLPDGLAAATATGLWLLDPEDCSPKRFLGDPEPERPGSRFNEMRCGPDGHLWVNTVDYGFAAGAGALYRRDAGGRFQRADDGLDVPNGLAWSPDGRTLYMADTGQRAILAYDHDPGSGRLGPRRIFARLPEDMPGGPDGLDTDRHGNLWVALFDGWRIACFAADGGLRQVVSLPVPRPTGCRFGGPDGGTLYIASARIRLSEDTLRAAPWSGAVLAFEP